MLGKITKQHMQNAFNKKKGFLGHAYNHTKGFLHTVDHGFRTAKHIYHAVAPLVDKYANNHSNQIHHHVNQAISGYEDIRNKAIEGDNDFQEVKRKIKG